MAKFAQEPRKRPVMSMAQRSKLSEAMKKYVANDPRWPEHREKLAEAQRKPEQRTVLSEKMKSFMESDPRWPENEQKMRDAALRKNTLTLYPEEVAQVVALRKKGRNMEYISEELCVSERVIKRGLKEHGIEVQPLKRGSTVKKGRGHWRSFDPTSYPMSPRAKMEPG